MRLQLLVGTFALFSASAALALPQARQLDRRDATQRLTALRRIAQRTPHQVRAQVGVRLRSSYYKPATFKIEIADNLGGRTPGLADVTIHHGLDGRTPDQVVEKVRSKLGTTLHASNAGLVERTIRDAHKAFTLAVDNAFTAGSPSNNLLKGELAGADVAILGVMSAVHPTVLMARKPGERTARFFVPAAGGTYQELEKLPYSVVMKARLEKGAEGGVRVSYHAWNHPALAGPISTVTEVGSRGGN